MAALSAFRLSCGEPLLSKPATTKRTPAGLAPPPREALATRLRDVPGNRPVVQRLALDSGEALVMPLPSQLDCLLVAEHAAPVVCAKGLSVNPQVAFADCPPLDVICVPGGSGVGPLMEDEPTLDFIRQHAEGARGDGGGQAGTVFTGDIDQDDFAQGALSETV